METSYKEEARRQLDLIERGVAEILPGRNCCRSWRYQSGTANR